MHDAGEARQGVDFGVHEHPSESVNWRRHRHGCPQYRERWFAESNPDSGEPMYQVFCLMETPPESIEEQEKCLSSRTQCWRLVEARRKAANGPDILPLDSVKRRRPA